MKAPNSRQISPVVSRTLKTVGLIMILASLLDMIILPIPYQVLERGWQIQFVSQVVDRGIIPMIGIALLLTGSWFEGSSSNAEKESSTWASPKAWALILSCILGAFYLVLFPLHLNNVRLGTQQTLQQIDQEATQAEQQLGTRLTTEVGQQRGQILSLLENPDQLNQALQSGQVSEDQATLLQQFQQDPDSLDQFLQQRAGELQTQFQTQIRIRQEEAQQTARTEGLKSGLRIGLSSLLLAIGYIVIGWTGLKNLGQRPGKRAPRKSL